MTAQEMFEKLGYKKRKCAYSLITKLLTYEKGDYTINFDLNSKIYITSKEEDYKWLSYVISIGEHQAITQQMIELGWINNNGQ